MKTSPLEQAMHVAGFRSVLMLAALPWCGLVHAATDTLVALGPPSGPPILETDAVMSAQSASGSELLTPWYSWSADAFAASTLGKLRVDGSAALTYRPELVPPGSPGYGPGVSAFAAASASDAVTVISPGRAGRIGKMIVVFTLDGSVATVGDAFSSATARAEFGYGTSRGLGFSWLAEDSTVDSDYVGITITRPGGLGIPEPGSPYSRFVESFPIVIGELGFLSFGLEGRSVITADPARSAGRASFELGRSFTWGGIQAVEIDGVAVPFTVESASGFDWAAAGEPVTVPEPATVWMLLFGLAIVGQSALRGRQTR